MRRAQLLVLTKCESRNSSDEKGRTSRLQHHAINAPVGLSGHASLLATVFLRCVCAMSQAILDNIIWARRAIGMLE